MESICFVPLCFYLLTDTNKESYGQSSTHNTNLFIKWPLNVEDSEQFISHLLQSSTTGLTYHTWWLCPCIDVKSCNVIWLWKVLTGFFVEEPHHNENFLMLEWNWGQIARYAECTELKPNFLMLGWNWGQTTHAECSVHRQTHLKIGSSCRVITLSSCMNYSSLNRLWFQFLCIDSSRAHAIQRFDP